MMIDIKTFTAWFLAVVSAFFISGCSTTPKGCIEPIRLTPTGNIAVHDPSAIKQGDTYYLFYTGGSRRGNIIPIRTSKDMVNWRAAGCVFDRLPAWCEKEVPGAYDSWAPDISFFNGEYHLYYSVSTFGRNTSAIGLATNVTLDKNSPSYQWVDHGLVVKSREGVDDFNAIDANLVYENDKSVWLCWGSFWGGIMMRQLDRETGMLNENNPTIYNLCARNRQGEQKTPPTDGAIEAPFIARHGKWWYLFASADFCCRGVNSNYNVIVGRAEKVTGPYLDKDGVDLRNGGGTKVLEAATDNWHGIGHQAILSENGRDYIFCHAYDARRGRSALQISTIYWKDGWPQTAPMP